jgi:hypothetical protein
MAATPGRRSSTSTLSSIRHCRDACRRTTSRK